MNIQDIKKHCENHLHRYVLVTTNDGRQFDAIVESVNDDHISLAVPINGEQMMHEGSPFHEGMPQGFGYGAGHEDNMSRQFTPGYGPGPYPPYGPPFGPPGYGPYPPYGPGPYPPYRPRRFQRLILPLAALTALAAIPYF
ncbi:hypothetical protein HXA34_07610 [Salipaludibacillus agaradhaerens]|uniref:hypothetical protein n=1 Tax=Salipaludibacillus agaradhaerens TaxID=76935 RepID=UPI002151EE55|nr:hypothetical protein [Salipaludibacillus agaradhaerens]MCR6106145.1 hypothetical protein [Salipaludibacillus agaradhaerens]MCR6118178.1 hypothetical protein [Salipaludibacillus agaradhaerens]